MVGSLISSGDSSKRTESGLATCVSILLTTAVYHVTWFFPFVGMEHGTYANTIALKLTLIPHFASIKNDVFVSWEYSFNDSFSTMCKALGLVLSITEIGCGVSHCHSCGLSTWKAG